MSQLQETKPEAKLTKITELTVEEVDVDGKPVKIPIKQADDDDDEDQEEPDRTVDDSNEKSYDPDDEPDNNDDYRTCRAKEKRRWKRILDSTPMETYDQIISKPIPQKDYANLKWDNNNKLPIDWLDLYKAKRWFMDNMLFKRKDGSDKDGSREQVSHNLLELSRLLKIADKHLDECLDSEVKERFLKGAYLRAVKRRNQVMNLWKAKDEEGCVQFLRENPIIGKYGKKVQETKPKKVINRRRTN